MFAFNALLRVTDIRLSLRRHLGELSPSLLSGLGTFHNPDSNDKTAPESIPLKQFDRGSTRYGEKRATLDQSAQPFGMLR